MTNCSTCRFYMDANGQSGVCHRFPESVAVSAGHWCGEWALPKITTNQPMLPGDTVEKQQRFWTVAHGEKI